MRYEALPDQLYINNRQKLIKQLAPKSMVLIFSNDIMPQNILIPKISNPYIRNIVLINNPQ